MKYLVVIRYLSDSGEWKTIEREFPDLYNADEYAQEMYRSDRKELVVLVYELLRSYN